MRKLASLVARVVFGLAAITFVLGALLFLLGLQLALVPMRLRQHAQARLVLDIAANVAQLVALRAEQTTRADAPADDTPEHADAAVV